MDNVYRITLKQQLLLLTPAIIIYGFLGAVYLFFFGLSLPTPIYLYAFLVLFGIDLLPASILHIQYLVKNSKAELIINRQTRRISYSNGTENLDYCFDDLRELYCVASYGGGRNTGYYSFGDYRFCKLIFKDDVEIVITCLMVNNIQHTLESLLGVTAKKKLKIFAFIK